MALLAFLGCLVGIVLVALITNRLTGTRAHYIEDLRLDPPEHVLWQEDGADVHIVPRTPQALIVSYARLRRDRLILTNKRLVCGRRTLLGRRHMILTAVFFDPTFPGAERAVRVDGGFWGGGFRAIIVSSHESIALKTDAQGHHLELRADTGPQDVDYIRIALDEPEALYQQLRQRVS
jgi:hypothetical protein